MKNKLVMLLVLAFTGCTSPQSTSFIENPKNIIEIGNKTTSVGALHFIKKNDGLTQVERQVTLYFDSIPFSGKFDLCKETKHYSEVTGQIINKTKNTKHVKKSKREADCLSTLKVYGQKNGLLTYGLELKQLVGFSVSEQFGEESYQPEINLISTPNGAYDLSHPFDMKDFVNDKAAREYLYFTLKK